MLFRSHNRRRNRARGPGEQSRRRRAPGEVRPGQDGEARARAGAGVGAGAGAGAGADVKSTDRQTWIELDWIGLNLIELCEVEVVSTYGSSLRDTNHWG